MTEHQSAKPCGCDPGCNWVCEVHTRAEAEEKFVFVPQVHNFWLDKNEVRHEVPKEVRHTSDTGAQKGRKLARFSLIPWDALHLVAEHFGRGAAKYEDRNWEGGYPWSWSYDALMRHLTAWWQGEDRDAETGSLHIVAVAWHALVLVAFQIRGKGTDDRSVNTIKESKAA